MARLARAAARGDRGLLEIDGIGAITGAGITKALHLLPGIERLLEVSTSTRASQHRR